MHKNVFECVRIQFCWWEQCSLLILLGSLPYQTHDLAVVDYMSDYVAVMYLGQIMEMGTKEDIFNSTSHPYTILLMNSIPVPEPRRKNKKMIPKGEIPSPITPPPGCRFHTRCPYAKEICKKEEPRFVEISKGHFVKCHFPIVE